MPRSAPPIVLSLPVDGPRDAKASTAPRQPSSPRWQPARASIAFALPPASSGDWGRLRSRDFRWESAGASASPAASADRRRGEVPPRPRPHIASPARSIGPRRPISGDQARQGRPVPDTGDRGRRSGRRAPGCLCDASDAGCNTVFGVALAAVCLGLWGGRDGPGGRMGSELWADNRESIIKEVTIILGSFGVLRSRGETPLCGVGLVRPGSGCRVRPADGRIDACTAGRGCHPRAEVRWSRAGGQGWSCHRRPHVGGRAGSDRPGGGHAPDLTLTGGHLSVLDEVQAARGRRGEPPSRPRPPGLVIPTQGTHITLR